VPTLAENRAPRLSRARVAVLSSVHEALDPRIFYKEARSLAAAGFEVHLLARHARSEQRDGVHITALPQPRSRWQRPLQWARLAWHTVRLRPRVIHIHDPELLPLLLLLKWTTGAAAVYDAHEYYGHEVARRAWIPAPFRRPAARLTRTVELFAARRIDAVVAVNEHMAAGFRRHGARARAIHNYPSVREQGTGNREQEGGGDQQPFVVGYVGLLSVDRGLATVYRTGRLLRQWGVDVRIRVIGRVDWDGLPAAIPRDVDGWASAGIELAGTIPAAAVPEAIAQFVIGWIPFQETGNNRRTIPLKLLEYMAAGRPVVASDIGFVAQIIRTSGGGMLVPPDDPAAHAAAITDLVNDPGRRRAMGGAARRAVIDHYTWAGEEQKLLSLYQRVLQRTRRRC